MIKFTDKTVLGGLNIAKTVAEEEKIKVKDIMETALDLFYEKGKIYNKNISINIRNQEGL